MLGSLRPITNFAGGVARRGRDIVTSLPNRTFGRPKPLDDKTLKNKVETELFRPAGSPKDKVNVDVVDGVVTLRGQAKNPTQVKSLEAAVRRIPEVRDVENLLKLPKTTARTRADAPGKAKRTAGRKPSTAKREPRKTSGRFNVEREPAKAEPTPKETAAKGAGRQAAPLGAEETSGGTASSSETASPAETTSPADPAETTSPAETAIPTGTEAEGETTT
jgi:hypothetical protein